ncbi:hypothetical protein ACIP1U_31305 [Cupriavidus sp. NPDC089707]|uniref:hypothetical protein n=1 Tax=Cupriavidus sp. NPDC089707 TaxID=3363963 RepID=UPI0037FD3339
MNRQLVVNGEVIGQHGVGINPVTPLDGQGNPNFSYGADYDFGYQAIVANYPNAAPGRDARGRPRHHRCTPRPGRPPVHRPTAGQVA